MNLSDAIRAGSKLRGQAFKAILGRDGGTCALGAAYEATRGRLEPGMPVGAVGDWLVITFPILKMALRSPCEGCHRKRAVSDIIVHLNDDMRWTREAIAEWVETIEKRIERVRAWQAKRAAAREEVAKPVASPEREESLATV